MIKIVTITLLLVVLLDNANSQPTTRHSPFSTFISHLQDFVRNPLYAQLIARERALYRRNGYYVDPKYVLPYTSAPTRCPPSSSNPNNPCYNVHYYPNGYAIAGYDREGYDINGYNLAGYNRSGYSRRVAKRGQLPPSAYDQLGNFLNPIYQSNGYRVIFDNYGNPYMGDEESGPITPSNPCYNTSAYEVLVYDRDGYDQYGNDIYGNPVYQYPPPCTRPPDSYSNIPDVGLICNSSSEIRLPNGKYRYIRKSASAMTTGDWQRFRNAWNNLVTTGEIGRLVEIHAQNFNQHQSPRFLPWHREFTARLEDALHRMDPCVFLPYWDVIQMPSFPQGVADTFNPEFPPDVILLNSMGQLVMTTPVNTAIGINGLLPNAGLQSAVLAQATFPVFSQAVEAFHDQIHVYVGGSLMFIATAPRHPVFYLLHANIDRLWHIWQQTHLGQPINSVITTLNPLTYGSSDTRTYAQESNINNVQTVRGNGYQYI